MCSQKKRGSRADKSSFILADCFTSDFCIRLISLKVFPPAPITISYAGSVLVRFSARRKFKDLKHSAFILINSLFKLNNIVTYQSQLIKYERRC